MIFFVTWVVPRAWSTQCTTTNQNDIIQIIILTKRWTVRRTAYRVYAAAHVPYTRPKIVNWKTNTKKTRRRGTQRRHVWIDYCWWWRTDDMNEDETKQTKKRETRWSEEEEERQENSSFGQNWSRRLFNNICKKRIKERENTRSCVRCAYFRSSRINFANSYTTDLCMSVGFCA